MQIPSVRPAEPIAHGAPGPPEGRFVPTESDLTLDLRPGEMVEVRSAREIQATLDEHGALDALPFMPEMLQFCGQRFRVDRRADKTCNTIHGWGGLRMQRTVHLANLRCDGQGHGGCQASCLLFWKEAWLKRVPEGSAPPRTQLRPVGALRRGAAGEAEARERLEGCARATDEQGERFICQATELLRASSPLSPWDLRQYVRDLRTGNVGIARMARGAVYAVQDRIERRLDQVAYAAFAPNGGLRRRLRGTRGPAAHQRISTPAEPMDLEPGELVEVRSRREIRATLDGNSRNRGLYYDIEMWRFSGGTYRVLQRVERIVDERSGRMRELRGGCVILEGVVCSGDRSAKRRFCSRSIPSYWRQIWLKRVSPRT
jgi:hypothetical protein